jgi:hypothetical protein
VLWAIIGGEGDPVVLADLALGHLADAVRVLEERRAVVADAHRGGSDRIKP